MPSVEAYFDCIHTYAPILDRHDFENRWELLYDTEPRQQTVLDYAKLCLVVALGLASSSTVLDQADESGRLSSIYHQRAWNLLHHVVAKPCISALQILLLHVSHSAVFSPPGLRHKVLFLFYSSKGGMAWALCGMTVRLAQALGLHRCTPRDFDLSEQQMELQSQLWCIAFGLDAWVSLIAFNIPN